VAGEEEFDGEELATITAKRLRRLLRGSAAEQAVGLVASDASDRSWQQCCGGLTQKFGG
jgi:hypothetical protein